MSYEIYADKDGKYTLPTKNTRFDDDIELIVDVGMQDISIRSGTFAINNTTETMTLHLGVMLNEKFVFIAKCDNQSLTTNIPSQMNVFGFMRYYNGVNEIEYNSIGGTAATSNLPESIVVSEDRTKITMDASKSPSPSKTMRIGTWRWTILEKTK